MICKGNQHTNGGKLARYMTTAKDGERVELWELSGFAANDIRDAFRSVHVMAEATRCEQPFFHVQVRCPEGEELSRDEWRRVVDRIESKLGLTNQPRAICFHIDEQTGHEHLHAAWSRIDGETLTARPLPFFKERLKEVARELEITLGLTRVSNEREDGMKAPRRDEFEQARRLGVDLDQVRKFIRSCWDHSDNGRSFQAALAEQGFVLARGDRRDFLVLDAEGGIHALGKRILDQKAEQVRARLCDLRRDALPTVEEARILLRDQEFVRESGGRSGDKSARKEREQGAPIPDHLRGIAREIWRAYNGSRNANEFGEKLEEKALLALVTKEEADRSYREAKFVRAIRRIAPAYRENEIVVVTEPGQLYRREGEIIEPRRVYRLNEYTTGQDRDSIEKFLAPLNRKGLQGIDATKEKLNVRASERAERREPIRLENAQRGRRPPRTLSDDKRMPAALGKIGGRAIAKTLDMVGDTLESFLAPKLAPEQKREGERSERRRKTEGENQMDYFRYQAERAEERRRLEQERENRPRGGGDRDR